jgi:hypothetical protein
MTEITVNTTTAGDQYSPVITRLTSGGFVVVWTSEDPDQDVLAQRFDAAGAPVGGEFRVNATEAGYQSVSAVEALPDGGFAVVWQDSENNGDIYVRCFDAAGSPVGSESRVNNAFANVEYAPGIAVAPDGSFLIHWQSAIGGVPSISAWAARFDAAGNRIGGDIFVQSTTNSFAYDADWIAISPTQFLMAYSLGGSEVQGRFVDFANASAFGTPFLINDPAREYLGPTDISLVRLADGTFAAAWAGSYGAAARVFDAAGTP